MQSVDLFDAAAHGLSAAEAAAMDPQHRWAWGAAALPPSWQGSSSQLHWEHGSGELLSDKPGLTLMSTAALALVARRLVLEAAGEALVAGSGMHTAKPVQTGVFIGISWTEYARMAAEAGAGEGQVQLWRKEPLLEGRVYRGAATRRTSNMYKHCSLG